MNKELSDFLSGVVPADLARQILELVDKQDGWVSVADDMPPENLVDESTGTKYGHCLAYADVAATVLVIKGVFHLVGGAEIEAGTVTHWKPLPDPPQGNGGE